MRRALAFLLTLALVAGLAAPAFAETTLEKIARTGVLTIGTRTGSPPFAYIDKNNEWVGFTIDLVEQGVLPGRGQEGRQARQAGEEGVHAAHPHPAPHLERRRSHRGHHDRYPPAARERGLQPDLLPHRRAVHGEEGEPHQGHRRHRGQARGRPAGLDQCQDHPREGAQRHPARVPRPARRLPGSRPRARSIPTPTTASSSTASRPRRRTRTPTTWSATFYSHEPYGMALRKGDFAFKEVVDAGLRNSPGVGQVLRALRQVVRSQERGALSDDRRGRGSPCSSQVGKK